MAIRSESGSISSQQLDQLRTKVQQTQATLETEDPDLIATLDREDLLGGKRSFPAVLPKADPYD